LEHSIAAGEIVHVPAGLPHQLLNAAGTTYGESVIEVKE
jgi:uncharacterized RmlC-like cupin family protein